MSEIDIDNPVIACCLDGTRAEFEGRTEDARALYQQALELSQDDYEACVAAHYLARHQEKPEDIFRWNHEALKRAEATTDERVRVFYPSLYLNMGRSHELLGSHKEARRYYELAAQLGVVHQEA